MLKHIVLFAFKDDADPAEIEAIFQRFAWLRTVMPEIRSFSWGKFNGTPVMPRHGYNHGFEMEFESEAERQRYLENDDHLSLAPRIYALLKDSENSLLAFGYEAST